MIHNKVVGAALTAVSDCGVSGAVRHTKLGAVDAAVPRGQGNDVKVIFRESIYAIYTAGVVHADRNTLGLAARRGKGVIIQRRTESTSVDQDSGTEAEPCLSSRVRKAATAIIGVVTDNYFNVIGPTSTTCQNVTSLPHGTIDFQLNPEVGGIIGAIKIMAEDCGISQLNLHHNRSGTGCGLIVLFVSYNKTHGTHTLTSSVVIDGRRFSFNVHSGEHGNCQHSHKNGC